MITYRKANSEDIRPALSLVEKVWNEVVMPQMGDDEREAYRRSVSDAKNEERVNQYISEKRFMDIAISGGKIVGMVGVDNEGYIRQLFVDKDFHRKGIATELLHRMVCKLAMMCFNVIK
jgi:ribosomal protein S18 acetylase RimI-like enzyme